MIRKLRRQLNHIQLSRTETDGMRSHILAYMQEHPAEVRNTDESRRINRKSTGLLPLFLTQRPMFVSIILALVAIVGGGTAFAAENTLPGDVLYPVKVHINENARLALSGSTEAKAKLEAKFAERRLEEAAKLEERGELKTDVVARLESNFSRHVDKVEQHIAKLTEEGKLEAATSAQAGLEVSIRAHQRILEKIREKRVEIKEKLEAKADARNATSTKKHWRLDVSTTADVTDTDDGDSATTTQNLPFLRPVDKILKTLEHRLEKQEKVREKIEERMEKILEKKEKIKLDEHMKVQVDSEVNLGNSEVNVQGALDVGIN